MYGRQTRQQWNVPVQQRHSVILCVRETEQERKEQNRTEQNRTEQNRTEQNRKEKKRKEKKRKEKFMLFSDQTEPPTAAGQSLLGDSMYEPGWG